MATFDHISGAEPSTVTFKLATVTQTRNSSKTHSEIMVLGDPDTSNAIAAVLNAVPASTAWAVAVRQVGNNSIQGNSTVFQGTSPWVIAGNSTVAPLAGSTWATRPIQSSAADLQMTATQGTNPWIIAGNSSVVIASGNSSVTISAGNSSVTISAGNSSVIVTSGQITSTCVQGTSPWIIGGNSTVAPLAGSTWATRPIQSSAADLQMTATPLAGSTWNTRSLCSSRADFLNTVYQSSASELQMTATIGTNLQSSVAPSSNSSGLIVRQVIDGLTTFASTSALASTSLSCASSVANIRAYVTAYTITSTNQTPAQWGFYSSNGTLLWPMTIAAISSAIAGVNLAVSPPGYLFRTVASEALNFKTNGSTVVSVQLGVSYYQAP